MQVGDHLSRPYERVFPMNQLVTVAVSGLLQNPYSSFATLIGASIVQGCYSVLLGIIVVIASEIYPTDIR